MFYISLIFLCCSNCFIEEICEYNSKCLLEFDLILFLFLNFLMHKVMMYHSLSGHVPLERP